MEHSCIIKNRNKNKPFFKFFVLRLGFLDGSMGFVLAITASFAAFYRYVLIGMLHAQADQAVKPGLRDF